MANIAQVAVWFTSISAAAAVLWRIFKRVRDVAEGQKCILRSDMMRTYYRHHESGTIRQYEFENFLHNYCAYKALGGNSFVDKIHAEVIEWEILP